MTTVELDAIVARVRAIPADMHPVGYTYGPPCVMIACKTKQEALELAAALRQVRADLLALLRAVDVDVEPRQIAMEL